MAQQSGILYRISAALGKALIWVVEQPISWAVPSRAVFQSNEFAWIEVLERNWPQIQREYLAVATDPQNLPDIREISMEQAPFIAPKRWTFYPFRLYGVQLHNQLKACPVTASTLAQIPNCTTAFFSVLRPGAQIVPHRGAFKGYLRLHLGVVVPSPPQSCGLRLNNTTYHWQEGKALVFDDTYIHDAFNDAASDRVVLYIDFIRPMPSVLVFLSQGLTKLIARSAYVQNSLRNLQTHNRSA